MIPKRPFSRKSSTTSHGNSPVWSISAARGAIRSRASVRTRSRISRCSAVSGSPATSARLERQPEPEPDEHAAGDALDPARPAARDERAAGRSSTASAIVEYQTQVERDDERATSRAPSGASAPPLGTNCGKSATKKTAAFTFARQVTRPSPEARARGRLVPLDRSSRGLRRSEAHAHRDEHDRADDLEREERDLGRGHERGPDADRGCDRPEEDPDGVAGRRRERVPASAAERAADHHRGRRAGRDREQRGHADEDEEPVHAANSTSHALDSGRDPRERPRPHARPAAPDSARARDRRRADRRRGRRPRDGARLARDGRPRRARRPPRAQRRARPLPELGARADRSCGSRAARPSTRRSRASREAEPAPAAGSAASAGGSTASCRRRGALDGATGDTPAALWSKDAHTLWVNSAALRRRGRARGRRRPARGGRRGRSASGTSACPRTEYLDAMRRGARSRGRARRHGRARQGRRARRARALAARSRTRTLARLAVAFRPTASTHVAALGLDGGLGARLPPARLPEGVHGRDARLADGADARRRRDRDHDRATSSSAIVRRAAEVVAARRGARDRRPREPRTRSTRSRRRATAWAPRGPAAADRARAAPRAGGRAALRGARRRRVRAVLARALGPRARRALLGRQDRRRVRLPLALRLRRGRRKRLGRAGRGARPARGHPRRPSAATGTRSRR